MKNIFYVLVIASLVGGVLYWSEIKDNARQSKYDKCFEIARANALPIPEYLQECMN